MQGLGWGGQWLVVMGCVLLSAAGCGAPTSEKPSKAVSIATMGKADDRASATQTPAGSASSDATTSRGNDVSLPPGIPVTVAKDLDSPDAHNRYRALDYWESSAANAPVDSVLDALEDADEAVRAKARVIVDRYVAAEEAQK